MFDPSAKYAPIYGAGHARYYQAGRYYTGDGREVVIEDGEERIVGDPPPEEPKPARELKKLPTFAVQARFIAAGGPKELATGEGARGRMLEWMEANGCT